VGCKLNGKKFIRNDAQRLREKAASAKWRFGRRREYYALFSVENIPEAHPKSLEKEGVFSFDLKNFLVTKRWILTKVRAEGKCCTFEASRVQREQVSQESRDHLFRGARKLGCVPLATPLYSQNPKSTECIPANPARHHLCHRVRYGWNCIRQGISSEGNDITIGLF
jgi:hypothetical protein